MKPTKYQLKVLRVWLRYYHFGYSFNIWSRLNWKVLSWFGLMSAISLFLILIGAPAFGWAYLGFCLGTLLRDITYFRLGGRNWPLMLDVVNWDRVQQLVDTHDKPVEIK